MLRDFGGEAYSIARSRYRRALLDREPVDRREVRFWRRVRSEIARRDGRPAGLDTATRYLMDA